MKPWPMWIALAVVLFLRLDMAQAQSTEPAAKDAGFSGPLTYTPPAVPGPPTPSAMLLRLGLATAFVLALCGAAMLLAYQRGRQGLGKTGGRKLQLVESFTLSRGSSLHLIQSAGQKFVVAVNRSGLHSLVALSQSFAETLETVHDSPLETPRRPTLAQSSAVPPLNATK